MSLPYTHSYMYIVGLMYIAKIEKNIDSRIVDYVDAFRCLLTDQADKHSAQLFKNR